MSEFIATVLVVLGIIGFFVVLWFGVLWASNTQCTSAWPAKFEPKFIPMAGCTILVNGDRVPSTNYRVL
jgi:hypothetical protein